MRQTRVFTDYNFRSYAARRVKDGFLQRRGLVGGERDTAIKEGMVQVRFERKIGE